MLHSNSLLARKEKNSPYLEEQVHNAEQMCTHFSTSYFIPSHTLLIIVRSSFEAKTGTFLSENSIQDQLLAPRLADSSF